ncbi:hypothetical protein DQ04_22631000, partial [Trypanosoma grayi]|uniref:hypothetical protein n=1 Tax=Trypanosoma grayi TaxID=71804 RepID=UPI0004F446F2
ARLLMCFLNASVASGTGGGTTATLTVIGGRASRQPTAAATAPPTRHNNELSVPSSHACFIIQPSDTRQQKWPRWILQPARLARRSGAVTSYDVSFVLFTMRRPDEIGGKKNRGMMRSFQERQRQQQHQ